MCGGGGGGGGWRGDSISTFLAILICEYWNSFEVRAEIITSDTFILSRRRLVEMYLDGGGVGDAIT